MAGLFLAVHPDPNSAETLANRLGQEIDAGDDNAAFRLAKMYRPGENQVTFDLARVVSHYKTAARFGPPPLAMNALAILHEQGWGVKDSGSLALQRYVKTARAGCAMTLANLGEIHILGDGGLRRDLAKKADNQSAPGAGEKVTSITRAMKSGKK